VEEFANNASTTLSAAIVSTGATTLTVASTSAFPGSGNFRVLIDNELVIVTGVAGTTWTITRGAEGTTAATHLNGAAVVHVLTAASIIAAVSERITAAIAGTIATNIAAAVATAVTNMSARDTKTFADATARAASAPVYAGQLGVQLSNNTLWYATGTSAGNWTAVA
jgi:hypothetical protein